MPPAAPPAPAPPPLLLPFPPTPHNTTLSSLHPRQRPRGSVVLSPHQDNANLCPGGFLQANKGYRKTNRIIPQNYPLSTQILLIGMHRCHKGSYEGE